MATGWDFPTYWHGFLSVSLSPGLWVGAVKRPVSVLSVSLFRFKAFVVKTAYYARLTKRRKIGIFALFAHILIALRNFAVELCHGVCLLYSVILVIKNNFFCVKIDAQCTEMSHKAIPICTNSDNFYNVIIHI